MTREEKILMAIKKGYVYNPETGQIFGATGKELIATHTKGYRYIKSLNKYKAIIIINKKEINLGLFDTPEEATKAYNEARAKKNNE